MGARGNFTSVRLTGEGTQLIVHGDSEDAADITTIHVVIGPQSLDADKDNPGGPLVDQEKLMRDALVEHEIRSKDWIATFTIEAGEYELGELVVVAGAQARTDGDATAVAADDVWLDSFRIIDVNDPQPKGFPD